MYAVSSLRRAFVPLSENFISVKMLQIVSVSSKLAMSNILVLGFTQTDIIIILSIREEEIPDAVKHSIPEDNLSSQSQQ